MWLVSDRTNICSTDLYKWIRIRIQIHGSAIIHGHLFFTPNKKRLSSQKAQTIITLYFNSLI